MSIVLSPIPSPKTPKSFFYQKIVSFTNKILQFAAAAKSLQSCPTLCDPIDGSPPGSAVPGILQARVLEWGAIAFSLKRPLGCFINDLFQVSFFSPVLLSSFSYGCSHKFWETNSLRRTMQIVKCSLLHQRAQGRVSS